MSTSLSSLVDNLSEIYSKKCRDKDCEFKCDFVALKNIKLRYKYNECKKGQLKPINELIKKFSNANEFCNRDINKCILLLRKGVYPYEYMDSWERFDETSLPNKKAFYSELNLEDTTDKDYTHAQKVFEKFKLKHLGEKHHIILPHEFRCKQFVWLGTVSKIACKWL